MRKFIFALGVALLAVVPLVQATTGIGGTAPFCCCLPEHTTDCTGVNLSHQANVNVTVRTSPTPSDAGSQATGLSGTAMSNQTVPVGSCAYIEYTFDCAQVGGKWSCELISWTSATKLCS